MRARTSTLGCPQALKESAAVIREADDDIAQVLAERPVVEHID